MDNTKETSTNFLCKGKVQQVQFVWHMNKQKVQLICQEITDVWIDSVANGRMEKISIYSNLEQE